MENYKASIELISGLKQKNGGNFPLMEANAIQVDPEGKRLDDKLSEIDLIIKALNESWEQISYTLNSNGEVEWVGSDTNSYSKLCIYILTSTDHGQSEVTLKAHLQTNHLLDPQFAHAHTISNVSGKSIAFRLEVELKGYVATKSTVSSGATVELARDSSTTDIIEGVAPLGLQGPIKTFKIGLYNNETPVSLSGHDVFIYGVRA